MAERHRASFLLDERIHLLATLLALYPFTDTEELSKEFLLSEITIKQIVHHYHVKRSKEKRSEINRRNGDNPKSRAFLWWQNHKTEKLKQKLNNGISRQNLQDARPEGRHEG